MLNTATEPNFIKTRSIYPDMQILRENKLHIIGVTDLVESLDSVQISLMEHLRWISSLTISQSLRKEFWEQIF